MTEAMREALGEKPVLPGNGENDGPAILSNNADHDLSCRAGPQTGVGIRPPEAVCGAQTAEETRPRGERIATPVTRSLVRDDSEERAERVSSASPVFAAEPSGAGLPRQRKKEGADAAFSPARQESGGNRAERVSSDALRAHFDSLCAQGEALRAELPGFDLDEALRDPAFLRLTAPGLGVGVREAWFALHREALEERAARRGAEEAKALLARAAAQGALRPREGGGLDAAALTRHDPRALSRGARERLREEIRAAAARGEKLYP